jgi:hypothetical protein
MGHLDFAVKNTVVAFEAVNAVFGDVDPVDGIHVLLVLKPLDVTLIALLIGDIAIAGRDYGMAGVAIDPRADIIRVVELEILVLDFTLGDSMTGVARGERTSPIGILEMTEETGLVIDSEMLARLAGGVARSAAKFLTASQLAQMVFMVEFDILMIGQLTLQRGLFVALQTGIWFHIGKRTGVIGSGEIS